ncbi:MAG TPA: hypothetical protein VNX87_20185 [Candidatus Sulfotelmatobacter sp.]|jgi:hypothetical protein|nr:hypothetical protein [Candidatus Sulfotelmatobacter sp.]
MIDVPELIGQFQREADALLRDLIKTEREQEPHLMQEDLAECIIFLCTRYRCALDEQCDKLQSADDLIDNFFAYATGMIEPQVESLRREIREQEIEDSRPSLIVIRKHGDES